MDALHDPGTSWWAKHAHAKTHIASLRTACDEYRERRPIEVRPETDRPGDTAYRFHQTEPIPLGISLIVGDVLHNLRSALDSLVLGLVSRDLDRGLQDREEHACQFPIAGTPDEFDAFWTKWPPRAQLVGDRVRAALRETQPFYGLEQAKSLDVENALKLTYEENFRFNALTTVSRLSNIDKHRRVTVAAWWPSITYWFGDPRPDEHEWHPNPPPYAHGQIVGIMRGPSDAPPPKVIHDFDLVLPEAPNHDPRHHFTSRPLPREAEDWHLMVGIAIQTALDAYVRLGD